MDIQGSKGVAPETISLPVEHFYIDVLASNPGHEIVEVKNGSLRILKADGTEIEERFHSDTEKLGVHKIISSGPSDYCFKIYTDFDGNGVAEQTLIQPDEQGHAVMWVAMPDGSMNTKWQKGLPNRFVDGVKTQDFSWQSQKMYALGNPSWNWDD